MSINYTWKIENLDVIPAQDGKENVVSSIHWRVTGEEIDNDNIYTGSVYSTTSVSVEPDGEFTEFNSLTEEQIIGWIQSNGVDKTATEEAISKQIENQKNPPIIHPTLPWLKTV